MSFSQESNIREQFTSARYCLKIFHQNSHLLEQAGYAISSRTSDSMFCQENGWTGMEVEKMLELSS